MSQTNDNSASSPGHQPPQSQKATSACGNSSEKRKVPFVYTPNLRSTSNRSRSGNPIARGGSTTSRTSKARQAPASARNPDFTDLLSSAEKLSAKKSPVKEPAVKEPAVKEPAVKEPAVKEPAVKEPAVKDPSFDSHNVASTMPAEPPLMWNPDNVRDVAESVGIPNLHPEAIRNLSQEVEFRLGQVITEATRFMQAGKRSVLGTQDIAQALKVLDVEPLYGYESTRPLRFGEASLGPGQPLYYVEDEEVDFEKLINAPLPKIPRDVTLTAHWLAIEGVQPSIPQNPSSTEGKPDLVAKGPNANPHLAAVSGNYNIAHRPLIKHVLSKELILLFDKISAALVNEDNDDETIALCTAALSTVRHDRGIHPLIPYLDQWVSEKVTHNLSNVFILNQMMRLVDAMLGNRELFLDPYITSLIPPVITCLIGRAIGGDSPEGDKFDLRDVSASLIKTITTNFTKPGEEGTTTRTRLLRTFLKTWLDPKSTLEMQYGALKGLMAVGGADSVRVLVVHVIKTWDEQMFQREITRRGRDDPSVKMMLGAIDEAIESLKSPSEVLLLNGVDETVDEPTLVDALGPLIGGSVFAKKDETLNKLIMKAMREGKKQRVF